MDGNTNEKFGAVFNANLTSIGYDDDFKKNNGGIAIIVSHVLYDDRGGVNDTQKKLVDECIQSPGASWDDVAKDA